jgi:hypothetical protein
MLSLMQPSMPHAESWTCSCCGQTHSSVPFSFAADFPDNYANLSPSDRDTRALISSDQCIIDGTEFWLRGCLEIPIHDSDEIFLWGLWAGLFEEDFDLIHDHWETPNRENLIGPFKGRLGNNLSLYPNTANLELTIKVQPLGARPRFFVDEPQLLADEQRNGISINTAREYSCRLMNGLTQRIEGYG